MKSVKIRSDFTVELPEEMRGLLSPGDSLEVVVKGGNVMYLKTKRRPAPTLREIIERVRSNPAENPPSETEIEAIIDRVRKKRR